MIFTTIHILNVVKIWVQITLECKQAISLVFVLLLCNKSSVYIFLHGGPGEEFDDVEDKATYRSMLLRDERRFKTADRDSDGIATREEFTAFLHPEEYDHMKNVVVQVTFSLFYSVKICTYTHLHCTAM